MKLITVVTTVASLEDARRLARVIVERRLAACAQLSQIESFYHWKGSLQNEPEIRISFTSTEQNYPAIEAALIELHPYDLPAIHAVEIRSVYEPYGRWVGDNSKLSTP